MGGFLDRIDVWRAAAQRKVFSGRVLGGQLPRLAPLLAASDDEIVFSLEFGSEALAGSFVEVSIEGALTLTCQRSLRPYRHPIGLRLRLGLIREEREEAGLLPGYEPLLVPSDGFIVPRDILEDELILALPLIPRDPAVSGEGPLAFGDPEAETAENPFAVLKRLRPD
ncbi:MAG: hypothetical protein KatS3mg125_1658 [Lysobacterales bacterium]|jgi:uncharacterized protein|nr:MAG: hypothetical protein KatS3mg125_1658 [Xanthomonadales bacterium]